MKIKYVQLESDAFLTDLDFIRMTSAERGLYCSLIFFLNSNDGKCEFDPPALSRLCNCNNEQEFEILWQNIAKKFQLRNGLIKHKRISKELRKAKNFYKACKQAGLRGAKKRWHGHNNPNRVTNGRALAKGKKGNVIEKEREDNTSNSYSNNSISSSSNSVREQDAEKTLQYAGLRFLEALERTIPPRNRSDRTCNQNVTRWLISGCREKKFNLEIFERVLDYAKEARAGQKPAAVFMALLKKDLEYRHG